MSLAKLAFESQMIYFSDILKLLCNSVCRVHLLSIFGPFLMFCTRDICISCELGLQHKVAKSNFTVRCPFSPIRNSWWISISFIQKSPQGLYVAAEMRKMGLTSVHPFFWNQSKPSVGLRLLKKAFKALEAWHAFGRSNFRLPLTAE